MLSFTPSPDRGTDLWAPVAHLAGWIAGTAAEIAFGLIIAFAGALALRRRGLCWTWAVGALAPALLLWSRLGRQAIVLPAAVFAAARWGKRWRRADVEAGGDLAQAALSQFGPLDALRAMRARLAIRRGEWITDDGLLIGCDLRGGAVRVPLGGACGGSHTLVLGATGSGKTVTQTWMAVRAIEQGFGAVVIDPKGDPFLSGELRRAAARAGRRFLEWSPEGPAVYNPLACGTETEVADKALAGERFTEPHYQRQAQRYLGHEVRVLRGAGMTTSLSSLVRHLEPIQLEVAARRLAESEAEVTFAYLDSLTARHQRDLAGTRDRLAILAESDAGHWLDPESPGAQPFDLLDAVRGRSVVYFRLDADRRPLLGQMLGAAVVQDLLTTVAALQSEPTPTVVVIDEFSAVAAEQVARLFGRGRSAGVSMVLGTQEFSDLRLPGRTGLAEQVLGNVGAVIAHRQMVPDSADLVAGVAGTRGGWVTAQRSDGEGTRTRVREYAIHPDAIKALPRGCAAVVVPGARPPVRLVRVLCTERHP